MGLLGLHSGHCHAPAAAGSDARDQLGALATDQSEHLSDVSLEFSAGQSRTRLAGIAGASLDPGERHLRGGMR